MARPSDSTFEHSFGDTRPKPGEVVDVAPGVRWLRMRLPFALDHINLWLLRDRDGDRDGWGIGRSKPMLVAV